MKRYLIPTVLIVLVLAHGEVRISHSCAGERAKSSREVPVGSGSQEKKKEAQTDKLSVTHHKINVHGRSLSYTATAGFIASGYYDLDTSYFATQYTANHIDIPPDLRKNITLINFHGGHQMYVHLPSLEKLSAHAREFFGASASGGRSDRF